MCHVLSDQLLKQAIAANHIEWFGQIALAAGGQVQHSDSVTWIYKPGAVAEVTIAFPTWSVNQASEALDNILDWCRAHLPIHQISCWCLDEGQPPDLGARLVARGFGWGWQPHWMWLDLQAQPLPETQLDGVQVTLEIDPSNWDIVDLPNYEQSEAVAIAALMQREPDWGCYFAARIGERVVGHCAILLSDTPIKMAGLYDVGVVPAAQGRGIGLALVVAACAWAKAKGCQHVTLNSTPMGRATYRKAGFVSLGDGQTWWMREVDLAQSTLRFAPLTHGQVRLVEALGRSDIVEANALAHVFSAADLNKPLINRGMTLAELVIQMRQPAALQWLARQGVAAATLTQVIPRLPVRHIGVAVQFYTQRVGFRVIYAVEDFAIVARSSVELHLYRFNGSAGDLKLSCHVAVQNIDGLWRECVANQAIATDVYVKKMPWGAREFTMTDPDQNMTVFTE